MEFLLFALFFFVILIPLVLGIIIPIYKDHSKVTGGIINYDSTMRKFVYKYGMINQKGGVSMRFIQEYFRLAMPPG